MAKPIIVITGASGFIGSAVCVDLAQDFTVIAIDRREPSGQLRKATPGAIWHILDFADAQSVSCVFAATRTDFAQIDFVTNLAAYCDFEDEWVVEYQGTNVHGTANVINASVNEGVKRLIFASSIAAMEPPASKACFGEPAEQESRQPSGKIRTRPPPLTLLPSVLLPRRYHGQSGAGN